MGHKQRGANEGYRKKVVCKLSMSQNYMYHSDEGVSGENTIKCLDISFFSS